MAAGNNFRSVQRGVASWMAVAALMTVGAFVIVDRYGAPSSPVALAERLMIAVRTDLFVVLWLAIAISNIARIRFISPDDIAGSGAAPPSPRLGIATAVLQNTLEQVAIAVPAHFALAIFYGSRPIMVPVLGGLFCLGRFFFWAGYARGAVGRAFGFALTFYPSVGALLLAIWLALS